MTDEKITVLTALTSLADADIFPVVDDPGGTAVTKYITASNIAGYVNSKINDGWVAAGETWTYASASTFTAPGDLTGKYQPGDRIKWTQTGVKYGVLTSVSYAASTTTFTIAVNADYVITNAAMTSPHYSRATRPFGFPCYFNYTPTYGGTGSLTYSSVTTEAARYSINGKTVRVIIKATGTTGGTTNTTITATLPVNSNAGNVPFPAVVIDSSTLLGYGLVTLGPPSLLYFRKSDSSNWGLGASRSIYGNVVYEML